MNTKVIVEKWRDRAAHYDKEALQASDKGQTFLVWLYQGKASALREAIADLEQT